MLAAVKRDVGLALQLEMSHTTGDTPLEGQVLTPAGPRVL